MVRLVQVGLGRPRMPQDEARRYRPIEMTFDARHAMLTQEIGDDWEPAIQAQWRANQASVRMGLLAELGTVDGEAKIDHFTVLGNAPWSIVFEHNELLRQVRSAFAHGDFYPALVGACALGERLLNELIGALRGDYENHRSMTQRVRRGDPLRAWPDAVAVLLGWNVLTGDSAAAFTELGQLRHRAVHFDDSLDVGDRDVALSAVRLVQDAVGQVFSPLGGPPTFIAGTCGASFFARNAEAIPLIKRVFLPRSALLSPAHRMHPQASPTGAEWVIVDDADYPAAALTDTDFAAALPAGIASMHADLGWTADALAADPAGEDLPA